MRPCKLTDQVVLILVVVKTPDTDHPVHPLSLISWMNEIRVDGIRQNHRLLLNVLREKLRRLMCLQHNPIRLPEKEKGREAELCRVVFIGRIGAYTDCHRNSKAPACQYGEGIVVADKGQDNIRLLPLPDFPKSPVSGDKAAHSPLSQLLRLRIGINPVNAVRRS